jgi:hypothetical protein
VAIFVTKTGFLPSGFFEIAGKWQYLSQKPGFYLCLGWWDLLDGAGGSDTASYLDVTKVIADRDRQ